jgi:phosphate transport system permease protein
MNFVKLEAFVFKGISYLAALTTVLILVFILGTITWNAIPALSWEYLLTSESDHMELGGGILNAIIGTALLALGSTIVAAPFAVGTAIYLKKYAKNKRLVESAGFLLDVLSGTPSIVLGIFGLLVLVFLLKPLTGGFSLISGVVALSILTLPVIERATENALEAVPEELEHASYALGATKLETLLCVTLPHALGGVLTGVVIGIGRAAEESAVVILTAGYSQFFPEFKVAAKAGNLFGIKIYPFQDLIGSLPMCVYRSFEFPTMIPMSKGFAAAFVLILIVVFLNTIARLLVSKWSKHS